jgi:hypothetical protein
VNADILLAVFVLTPFAISFLLRSSGALVFMSVCLGSILATYAASDASSVISGASRSGVLATMQWVQLALLAVPVVLTLLLTRKKVKGIKFILSSVTAALAGGLLALLAVPYMSASMQSTVHASQLWHQLDNLQTAIILAGSVLTTLYLFATRWQPEKDHTKKHK